MTVPDPTAVNANAYAIAYRLLGDRPAAQATVGIAVQRVQAVGALERPDWVAHIAAATVAQAVGVAAAATLPAPSDPAADGLRTAMRRRLASASDDERVAASLHHLAGYSLDQVAAFMGRPVDEVARLARALAPPPGVSYRDLGDSELVGPSPPPRRRRRGRVSVSTIATVVVVVALVFAVSRCVGPRPTLGPEPERVAVSIGPDVAPEPSDGCTLPPRAPGTYAATAPGEDGEVPFRLAVPATPAPTAGTDSGSGSTTSTTTPGSPAAVPRALVLEIADTDQTADSFATTSGLERAGLDAGSLVATMAPQEAGTVAAVTAAGAVLESLLDSTCVDTSRVTVTGLGSGGQTATALACDTPSRVAVAAAVAGASMPSDCDLSPAVSLQLLWAADDQTLPPTGGYGPRAAPPSTAAAPLPPTPAGEVTADWARAIGAGQPDRSTGPDGTTVEEATSPDGAAVRWVTAPTGGHAWTPATTTAVLLFAQEHARSA
jgi:poly(3-hydroxybutyrate) depolymerase/DNA-directed RNA polymerase specialized sigma24 family protein